MGDCCSSEVHVVKDSNTVDTTPMLHHKTKDRDEENEEVRDSDDDIYPDQDRDDAEDSKPPIVRGTTLDEFGNSVEEQWQHAVQASDNKTLKQLFQKYQTKVDFLSIVFENGDNSLHYAARTGNVKLSKLLILIGIDVC